MFPRITNPSDISKSIIGTFDHNQTGKLGQIYDEYDYQLTPKKLIIRVVVILFISLVTTGALYIGLFVLDFGKIPAKSISVSETNISSNNMLSFQLKCVDFYLTDTCNIKIIGNENAILYFTVRKPIITKGISHKQIKTDLLNKKYEIGIDGISAVYYMGDNFNDKLLIWKR